MLDNPQVAHDIECPRDPQTAFGYVAEGLRRRKASGAGPITILSCDNLQHNGNTARRAFMSFVEAQDKELAAWMEENVTFPNSMVDRITSCYPSRGHQATRMMRTAPTIRLLYIARTSYSGW